MTFLAYLIAWVHSYFIVAIALSFGLFAVAGLFGNSKRPGVNRLASIPLLLMIPLLLTIGLHFSDTIKFTHHLAGRIVAGSGKDATIEVGKMTHSYRARRSAVVHYDVTIHYADGSTKRDNVNLLGVLETNDEWFSKMRPKTTGGPTMLNAKYLPHLKDSWVVTGVQRT